MFSEPFKATIQDVKWKRRPLSEGGGLTADILLEAVLTTQMANDLGPEIVDLLASDTRFQSIVVANVVAGLFIEIWYDDQDVKTIPYLSINNVSTKKYKLGKDKDIKSFYFITVLKTSQLSEADMGKIMHCYGCDIRIRFDFSQGELDFDSKSNKDDLDN